VRGAAVWALSRLLTAGEFAEMRTRHMPRETDSHVRDEWMVR
jgi:epoxyqueuosine reductase